MAFPSIPVNKANYVINLFIKVTGVVKPHCPNCRTNLAFIEFYGDFNSRSYYLCECVKCGNKSIVVLNYQISKFKNKKEGRQNVKNQGIQGK
jgi:Zn ribbon nucleic-acid-binding protein